MDVNHIRALVTVAEEESFGKAAKRLGLSPSRVTRLIHELEREFRTSAFVRNPHRVVVTDAARSLLPPAEVFVAEFQRLAEMGRRDGGAGAMDMRDVEAVITIAEEQNFARAAERLFITASPLSRRIHDLESELGYPIFERGPRTVTPTAEGRAFITQAVVVQEAFHRLRAQATAATDIPETSLLVGASLNVPAVVLDRMFELLDAMGSTPGWNLSLASSRELSRRVDVGSLDVCIAHVPLPDASLATATVFEYDLVVAVRDDDPLAGLASVTFPDLRGREVVFPAVQSAVEVLSPIRAEMEAAGVRVARDLETADPILSLGHVARIGSVTMLSEPVVDSIRHLYRDVRFVCIPLHESVTRLRVGVAWRPATLERKPVLRAFIDAARRPR
ncbi:LysR family transcriptional regulator [Mycolicibacterium sp.]|uniref:LysR family transcriptional regulator n=1 Tax=Mycolicibacterium sp. TaxID=2320850 RepID=UPI003D13DF21